MQTRWADRYALRTQSMRRSVIRELLKASTQPVSDRHVRRLRVAYAARWDAMLSAMAACFPPSVTWTRPAGGPFIWATPPSPLDAADRLAAALEQKVACAPVIEEGIARLGRVLARIAS